MQLAVEYEAEYDSVVKALLAFAPLVIALLLFLIHFNLLPTENEEEKELAQLVLIGSFAAILGIYYLILPRKFRLFEDRLEIVLGFVYSIKLQNIKDVRKAENWKIFAYRGIRFATSTKNVVEIRKNRFGILISPKNPDFFIEQIRSRISKI
ncbi:MAG: PH domain-containing protein [Archaeoglobaceae archaeon]